MCQRTTGRRHWQSPRKARYVAWDSYASGSYDLYLRSFEGGQLTPIRRITHGPEYEGKRLTRVRARWPALDRL